LRKSWAKPQAELTGLLMLQSGYGARDSPRDGKPHGEEGHTRKEGFAGAARAREGSAAEFFEAADSICFRDVGRGGLSLENSLCFENRIFRVSRTAHILIYIRERSIRAGI